MHNTPCRPFYSQPYRTLDVRSLVVAENLISRVLTPPQYLKDTVLIEILLQSSAPDNQWWHASQLVLAKNQNTSILFVLISISGLCVLIQSISTICSASPVLLSSLLLFFAITRSMLTRRCMLICLGIHGHSGTRIFFGTELSFPFPRLPAAVHFVAYFWVRGRSPRMDLQFVSVKWLLLSTNGSWGRSPGVNGGCGIPDSA